MYFLLSTEKSAVINKDVKKTTLKKNNVQLIHEIDNSINFQTKQGKLIRFIYLICLFSSSITLNHH